MCLCYIYIIINHYLLKYANKYFVIELRYLQSSCCDKNRRADISAKVHPPMKNTRINFGGSELESSLVIEFPKINICFLLKTFKYI